MSRPFYLQVWFIILMYILFIPFGIVLTIMRCTDKTEYSTSEPSDPKVITAVPKRGSMKFTNRENHHVAGVTYYQDNFMQIADENSLYYASAKELKDFCVPGEKIYKYEFPSKLKVQIIEETEGQYAGGLAVYVNDLRIGSIKSGSNTHVKKIISQDHDETIEIMGGEYKQIREDDDGKLRIEKSKTNFYATVTLWWNEGGI